MSHECPDCGLICHCGSDIDDCCFNHPVNVLACQHWRECEKKYNNDENDPEED